MVSDTYYSGSHWSCPNSPDGHCHYRSVDGRVLMDDGRWVPVPKNHDAMNESKEWCIFCREPSERK